MSLVEDVNSLEKDLIAYKTSQSLDYSCSYCRKIVSKQITISSGASVGYIIFHAKDAINPVCSLVCNKSTNLKLNEGLRYLYELYQVNKNLAINILSNIEEYYIYEIRNDYDASSITLTFDLYASCDGTVEYYEYVYTAEY